MAGPRNTATAPHFGFSPWRRRPPGRLAGTGAGLLGAGVVVDDMRRPPGLAAALLLPGVLDALLELGQVGGAAALDGVLEDRPEQVALPGRQQVGAVVLDDRGPGDLLRFLLGQVVRVLADVDALERRGEHAGLGGHVAGLGGGQEL